MCLHEYRLDDHVVNTIECAVSSVRLDIAVHSHSHRAVLLECFHLKQTCPHEALSLTLMMGRSRYDEKDSACLSTCL
jgi:hypothetical protein